LALRDSHEPQVLEKIHVKLDEISTELEDLKQRVSLLEEESSMNVEDSTSSIVLRPTNGQTMAPTLLRELIPDWGIIASNADSPINVDNIITNSMMVTLQAINDIIKKGNEPNTENIAKNLGKSPSTIRGRLNMLYKLGLINKKSGRPNKYVITNRGQKKLENY